MINIINNNINIVNILLGGIRKRVAVAKSSAAAQVKGLKLPNGEYLLTIPEWNDEWQNVFHIVNDDVLTVFNYIYIYNEDTGQYEDHEDDTYYIKILSFDNKNLIYTIEADGDSGTIILNSEEEPEPQPDIYVIPEYDTNGNTTGDSIYRLRNFQPSDATTLSEIEEMKADENFDVLPSTLTLEDLTPQQQTFIINIMKQNNEMTDPNGFKFLALYKNIYL